MSDSIADYRRVRTSALQQLAKAGDRAAIGELQSRGVDVSAGEDLSALSYLELRAIVLAWNSGDLPEQRDRSFTRAQAAQFELDCRYVADSKVWNRSPKENPPTPPPAPPWLHGRSPRTERWQRPGGSKLYPSPVDEARLAFSELARELAKEGN